jgi:hypothetical protein
MPLGNCAAVAWENTTSSSASPISTSTSSSFTSSCTTTSPLHTTQSLSTTQTTSASGTIMLPPSSSSSSSTTTTTSPTDAVKAAFTLRGFSGNEGPGGPAEQHLNFGQSSSSGSMGNITSVSGSASACQAGKILGALWLSTAVAWAFT